MAQTRRQRGFRQREPVETFETGQRNPGIGDLVRARQRRQRQVEAPAFALVAHPGLALTRLRASPEGTLSRNAGEGRTRHVGGGG